MNYHIITTQPKIFDSFLKTGLISRGIEKKIINIKIHSLYDYGLGVHKSIDDTPYGGGAGMILRVDVTDQALNALKTKKSHVILLTPQGKRFTQVDAHRLAKKKELIFLSGRFEGYDERIRDLADEEISLGDFVLTSGDLPAMTVIDAVSRQIPGFIEEKMSLATESFDNNLLEYSQYTRPETFKKIKVPAVLLSGNHAEIEKWRKNTAVEKTKKRPDLFGV
jgi:tRNA (guanine37-N1)-methyltransferase